MHLTTIESLTFLIGTILPLLTGLVTKSTASNGLKAVVLLALSGVTSVVTNWAGALTGHTSFDVGATLLGALSTFLVGVAAHFGFWKATGLSAKVSGKLGFVGPKVTK